VTGRAGRKSPVGNAARGRRFVRPVRPLIPLVSCAGVLLAWGLVAHNSGAGWVQAVGDLLAGILGVGLVAPAFVALRAKVAVFEVPSDGTAGLPLDLMAT
jgi:Na+-translocating ferredoxin:NAD+ oxidoreductase RnfA subunit